MKSFKRNFLISNVIVLALFFSDMLYANPSLDVNCPSLKAIQSAGIDRAMNLHDNTWIGIKYNQYNTKVTWMLLVDSSGAHQSEAGAIKRAELDLQFCMEPKFVNGVCEYNNGFNPDARSAVAIPVSTSISMPQL